MARYTVPVATPPRAVMPTRPPRRPLVMVLIDDNLAAHEGLVARIRDEPDFRVVAVLAEVEAALEEVRSTRPDLVLLNLTQVGDDSLTLAGALHGEAPESGVVMLGMLPHEPDVASLVRAGVAGFVMAGASYETFLDTITAVASGIQVLPDQLTPTLFRQLNQHTIATRPQRMLAIERLTAREREVADLIAQGCSNRQIAVQLCITVHTVKCHVHNVLGKLAVNSRLEIAALSNRSEEPSAAEG